MVLKEAQREVDPVAKPANGADSQMAFQGYKPDAINGAAAADNTGSQAAGHAKLGFPDVGDHLKTLQMAQLQPRDGRDGTAPAGDQTRPRTTVDVINYGASPAFAQEVASGAATLPEKVAQELKANGIKVDVFKDIYAYDRAMGTHKADLKVNGHSAALDAASIFESDAKPPHIAVFENLGDGTPVKSDPNTDVGGLARHEAGHAHSWLQGYASVRDPKFQAAMIADINNLTPAQRQLLQKEAQPGGPMNYYLGTASKEEFYAEAFAVATGRGSAKYADTRLRQAFPNVLNYLHDSTN